MEPRPYAFHKMEALMREMQDPESGVPVRSQKIFLTHIPSAFIGCDLIEWLMEHLNMEDSGEAVHLANQLCQYGYIFPVTDCKTLSVKDDNSLYRFQAAYYWPWHHKNPDNMEHAIYLVKRTLRNKQRHALEDYELEALASLKRTLQNKWELVTMQAEEQAEDGYNVQKNTGSCVKIGKERKKTDKLVADSQERAYWRIHKPPPGCVPPLEPSPILSLRRIIPPSPGNTELDILKRQVSRSRVKASQAIDSLISYSKTYCEYDPFLSAPAPSNPWISDDPSFWQFNAPLVEIPTEKRVKRWALSFEDLLADPTGVEEFTSYLRKEYSHENIRFYLAVKELRRCSLKEVPNRVNSIFEEFLAHGAPCEINIDSKTQESSVAEMKNPSRYTFGPAAHHVYTVLLAKDCYPRFIRSDQYKTLLANAIQHHPTKKRFFNFGGGGKKKSCGGSGMPTELSSSSSSRGVGVGIGVSGVGGGVSGGVGGVGKRRGSDRSLTGGGGGGGPPPHPHHHHHQQQPHHAPSAPAPSAAPTPHQELSSPHLSLSSSQSNLHHLTNRESGVSPERCRRETVGAQPPPASVFSSAAAGLTLPGPSLESISRKLSNCNLQETKSLNRSRDDDEPSSAAEEVPKVEVEQVPKENEEKKEEMEVVRTEEDLPSVKEPGGGGGEEGGGGGGGGGVGLMKKKGKRKGRLTSSAEGSADDSTSASLPPAQPQPPPSQGAADICPWEDEENCKTEEPFVKKYATLGYL